MAFEEATNAVASERSIFVAKIRIISVLRVVVDQCVLYLYFGV